MALKGRLLSALPRSVVGLLDTLNPEINKNVRPLNGQSGRADMLREIIQAVGLRAVVETGTYRGGTASFFGALSDVPVITVEAEPRFYAYSKRRLNHLSNVEVVLSESAAHLKKLAMDPQFPKSDVLFYLDAHASGLPDFAGSHPLPIRAELRTILNHWSRAVVLIDDFQVLDDRAYGYDDYGPAGRLTLDAVADLLAGDIVLFYPALSAEEETGARRGCIVLAWGEPLPMSLTSLRSLRRAFP